MLTHILAQAAQDLVLAAEPTPTAEPGTTIINTSEILKQIATMVVPILLSALGVVFLARSRKGQVSQVVTSSGIAFVGLAFIAGAGTLFFVGDALVDLILAK